MDGKKKELIGNFRNPGAVWCDEPEEVNVYDFLTDAECRATPYGIYDLLSGRGHICVGISSDTPAFAVESIRSWWARYGCNRYRGRTIKVRAIPRRHEILSLEFPSKLAWNGQLPQPSARTY